MFNIKNPLALAVVAGAGLLSSLSAHAMVTVPVGGTYSQVVGAFSGRAGLDSSYSFTLDGTSDLTGFAFASLINNFTVKLTGGSGTYTPDTTPASFGYSGLGAGTYTLNFSGNGTNRFLSGYAGAFKVVPGVPEPATVALALMAAGLLGGMKLRNRKQDR